MTEDKAPTLDEILAQFWNAFGMGAARFIEPGCYKVFIDKGYYQNIKNRLPLFADPKVLKRTLMCCLEAGQEAARLAAAHDEPKITPKVFLKAVEKVEFEQAERVAASEELRTMKENNVLGGVC